MFVASHYECDVCHRVAPANLGGVRVQGWAEIKIFDERGGWKAWDVCSLKCAGVIIGREYPSVKE